MLVEVGRVAGNMKHRMVTIVPIHNVFKLMGARIIMGRSFSSLLLRAVGNREGR